MVKIKTLNISGYEKVVEGVDEASGLHCFIAIHDSTLGPAVGGTRIYPYLSSDDALKDVLRLAEGMTYKSSVAKIGAGGGKAVVIGDPEKVKTEAFFQAYGEVLNTLEGAYITAEDVGTTPKDMERLRQYTPHIVGLPLHCGSGDPSPFTAWGVFRSMQAVCLALFNTSNIRGKTVAIQGLGKVGASLAEHLFWHGANLIVADVNLPVAENIAKKFNATLADPTTIHKASCDFFAPCALGGVLNETTIPELNCLAVVGATNNQLLKPEDVLLFQNKGILYAPDFVVNAGGIINVVNEIHHEGYSATKVRDAIELLYETLIYLLEKAKNEEKNTLEVAMEIAHYNIEHHIGKRRTPVVYTA